MIAQLILLLLSQINYLQIDDENLSVLLLPRSQNIITPFILIGETNQEKQRSFEIGFRCSEDASKAFRSNSKDNDICNMESYNGTIDEVNRLLVWWNE